MRVVAGTAGGLRLVAPPGRETRPTSDRVREATFNALGSLGAVDGARVLDLFAGSGALGIEALSRGADHATFVERDRAALEAIRANLATTGLDGLATVVPADATAFIASQPEPYDLALLDPPYGFDGWAGLLTTLPAELVVAESDRAVDPGDGWTVVRSRRYSTTLVGIFRRDTPFTEAP
jgi:16S rRNA (guanine966-N2)-methyltransferase